jgi:hypothetical protein
MVVFAFFPLVFAAHQLVEAVVWRSMDHPFEESVIFRYAYVVIAFLVWPVLAPLAALIAETQPARKPFWKFLLLCGLALSAYLIVKLLASSGVDVTVNGPSLDYEVVYDSEPPAFPAIAYVVITMLSFLLLDNKAIRLVGVAIFLAFIYSILKMRVVWYSVWCMSAAIFSLMLALAVREEERFSAPSDKRSSDSDPVLQ